MAGTMNLNQTWVLALAFLPTPAPQAVWTGVPGPGVQVSALGLTTL